MKNSFGFRTFLMLLQVFTLNFGIPLYAEKIVNHLYSSEHPDAELESILYLAIGIELTKAGLSSALSDEKPEYRLNIDYGTTGTAISVRLGFFDENNSRKALASAEFLLTLDETLDSAVATAVSALLAEADIDASTTGTEEIEGLLSKTPANDSPTEPAPLPETVPAPKPAAATSFIDATVSAGGLMLFGAATDYFHYGAQGALSAGYAVPVGKLALTPGLRISATRIFTDAEVTGKPLYISTAGINLQYGTGNDRPFRASGVGSAGAAVLSTTIGGRLLHKTVPYADIGVHTGLPLGRRFFLGAEARFLTVFDPDIVLIGVVTALALNKEF